MVPARRRRAWPPIARWIGDYDASANLVYDLTAGLTVGVMAIPQSLSYALIAGLPPQYGLYSDLQICYPVFGTSKFLVVGPVAVMSLMSRQAMEKLDLPEGGAEWIDMVCFLSVLVSAVQFAIGLGGLGGRISLLLPESAIAGFSSAAALIIGSTQLPALLGLPKCKNDAGLSCDFAHSLLYSGSNLGAASPYSLACGLLSALVLVGFKRLGAANKRRGPSSGRGLVRSLLPNLGALTVVCTSVLVMLLVHGLEADPASAPLQVVGAIPRGLPSPRWVPQLPRTMHVWRSLLFSSVPIALVGFAEATAIAKASTKLRGGNPDSVSENDEVVALAFCNAFTAWVGGYPVTGSFSRTAINAESGARSALSTAIAAAAVVVALLFLTPYLALLPKAAVSAIVLTAVARLVDLGEFLHLLGAYRRDPRDTRVVVFGTVFAAALLLGVETGLLAGVAVHRALVILRPSPPAPLPAPPGLPKPA